MGFAQDSTALITLIWNILKMTTLKLIEKKANRSQSFCSVAASPRRDLHLESLIPSSAAAAATAELSGC